MAEAKINNLQSKRYYQLLDQIIEQVFHLPEEVYRSVDVEDIEYYDGEANCQHSGKIWVVEESERHEAGAPEYEVVYKPVGGGYVAGHERD